MVGNTYGKWTVIAKADNIGKDAAFLCRCVCGTEKSVRGHALKSGNSKQCRICQYDSGLIDLTGKRYGRLVVLGRTTRRGKTYWNCLCDCGLNIEVKGSHLQDEFIQSCRCLQRDACSAPAIKLAAQESISRVDAAETIRLEELNTISIPHTIARHVEAEEQRRHRPFPVTQVDPSQPAPWEKQ